jgi:hypothetical protein
MLPYLQLQLKGARCRKHLFIVCHNQSFSKKLVLFLYGLRSELISLSNAATTVATSNDCALGGTMIAVMQSPSGYFIHARPRIDRFVNTPSRYRSPFKCISPTPEINFAKAMAIRMKFCT